MKSIYRNTTITLLGITLLLGGCATTQVAEDARGTGVKKIYDKPKTVVWNAMKTSVIKTDGEVTKENEKDCEILANYGVTAFSWGERVGVFCSKQTDNKTEIEIVSKRAVSVNITAKDWTEEIYKILDSLLK